MVLLDTFGVRFLNCSSLAFSTMLRMRVEAFLVAPFLGFLPEVIGLPLSATAVKFGLV